MISFPPCRRNALRSVLIASWTLAAGNMERNPWSVNCHWLGSGPSFPGALTMNRKYGSDSPLYTSALVAGTGAGEGWTGIWNPAHDDSEPSVRPPGYRWRPCASTG